VLVSKHSLAAVPRFTHLRKLMAPAGIVQFCRGLEPDAESGTCLDDNARALLVAIMALAADPSDPVARAVGDAAARFVFGAQRPDGSFHNLADIRGDYLDDVGSEESIGRAIWVSGVAVRCSVVPEWQSAAAIALKAALPAIGSLRADHSRAYAVFGLASAIAPDAVSHMKPVGEPLPASLRSDVARHLELLCKGLLDDHRNAATRDWPWWRPQLTWGNGRLPEALIRAACALGSRRLAKVGLGALEFLASVTQSGDVFVPIGNDGWYERGGVRSLYDQQPIEACAMTDAWLAAHRLTGESAYRARAQTAYDWFHGRNTERLALAVPETGGCYDGLRRERVNENQGAESTLSYLHSHLMMAAANGP
jgi:hypothetical protein